MLATWLKISYVCIDNVDENEKLIQDLQMIDGSHRHVCDTSPSLLLLSPPNESTLNPRAQHVMMGRALPNSACRGPTAVMEEWERCKFFFSEENSADLSSETMATCVFNGALQEGLILF